MTEEKFEQALAAYLAAVTAQTAKHYAEHLSNLTPPVLVVMTGPKYLRIVEQDQNNGDHRRVFCFVEKATGDILKPESWKKPAKGARGSIYKIEPRALTGAGLYR